MLLSPRLPLANLIELCRALRHYLGAGLSLVDAFRQQAKSGARPVRPVADRLAQALARGESLEDALRQEERHFPPLFSALVRVGEHSGMLAEVFGELERYFAQQRKLWRQFIAQITWPAIQFVMSIGVLALLILIMGLIADAKGGEPLDPLGLGLSGPSGAVIFLLGVFGIFAGLGAAYGLLRRSVKGSTAFKTYLLRLPAIGPCMRALALTRFCMALRLTTETGMPIVRAMRLSLSATGNEAFAAKSEQIADELRGGEELTTALTKSGLFPEEFQHMLAVAEESGTLDQVLAHQTKHYHEEAGRRLAVLTGMAGYGVWAMVGLIIIVAIFRIFNWYLSLLNSF